MLIGRNNAGKSAVFGALLLLSKTVLNEQVDFERVLPARYPNRSLEMILTFESEPEERREFVSLLYKDETGQYEERHQAMLDGPLVRRIRFVFGAPEGRPELLHLKETKLRGEDDEWATVQRAPENLHTVPESKVTNIGEISRTYQHRTLGFEALDVSKSSATGGADLPSHRLGGGFGPDPATRWPQNHLAKYLGNAFFFDPFRRSRESMQVGVATELERTGNNLAQVLNTISSNAPPNFAKIGEFVQAALPDAGVLHAPIKSTGGSSTETGVGFLAPDGSYTVPLRDMGGGVEQLLMAAVVLLKTGDESSLFLEEPEGHLHAGAQRYLIEKLYNGNRQVFVTTHSPTFVNQARPKSLYRVSLSGGVTRVSKMEKQGDLGGVLEDVGARNSDVLLSDAVLFVEGKGDRDALSAWANTLRFGLAERNVAVLPMGGGEHVARGARPRSGVLGDISNASPVPHMFVVDRDERPVREVEKLRADLGDKLHVLEKRELENYLLLPRAIKEALRSKHAGNAAVLEKVDQTTDEKVQALIASAAESLRGRVLLNRVRAEVPGLRDGFMTRDIARQLIVRADDEDLPEAIHQALKGRVVDHLADIDLATVVREQRESLREDWADPEQRPDLAPGTEVLEEIFGYFGSRYDKSKDARRVAKHMTEREIPEEIKGLLNRVAGLVNRAP